MQDKVLRVVVALILLVSLALAQDTSLVEVKEAFDAANIPADEHLKFDPSVLLEVTFPENNLDAPPVQLTAGMNLNRNQTAIPPTFALRDLFIPNSLLTTSPTLPRFVVAMVDPDAPTPQDPTHAQIRHFLGGNFALQVVDSQDDTNVIGPGGSLYTEFALKNTTPAVTEFHQPTPSAGSDPHRYTFLIFNQPADFNARTPLFVNASTSITNFNISQFALDVGLGNPIGGTFMLVGPDATST